MNDYARPRPLPVAAACAGLGLCAAFALGGNPWVDFTEETADRFLVAPALGANDQEEKDYEWGDVNNNGWVDLVIMRKQPFSTPGRRINVLMMNEGGMLVDRTEEYATASDVPGDEGFLTPTNDRHSRLTDLLNNGWLDLVTATAYGTGLPKEISHPRIYRNLGEDAGNGSWLGFIYEAARIPQLQAAPHTCAVATGDVTENGFADLYFVTYGKSTFTNITRDFLLINDEQGYFTNETASRLPSAFYDQTSFGTAGYIADLNNNGLNDIIQSRASSVRAVYNQGQGQFGANTIPPNGATYHLTLGDLNNNGRLDLITIDDGQDRYNLNMGANANGTVNWSSNMMLPESSCGSGSVCTGFGGNTYAVDFNNDGWLDIIVADVDVDIGGCGRYSNLYRNNANGPNVTFTRDLGNIPVSMMQGVFDFAPMDITGNGWLDLVVGRCSGTQVWINNPPFALDFDYPAGRPAIVDVGSPTPVTVALQAHGGSVTPGSVVLHLSVDGGTWQTSRMSHAGGNEYAGHLPAVDCGQEIAWFVSAQVESTEFRDPPQAPNDRFESVAAEVAVVVLEEDFDEDDGSFTVSNDPSLTQGAWQHGAPAGALLFGQVAAPFGDSSATGNGSAWTTCLGGAALSCNVDHGPTHLISPAFDLSDGPAEIVYDRWMFCHNADNPNRADFLRTYVSNDDGVTWTFVHETGGTGGEWETASFLVSDYVSSTATVRVRFTIRDESNDSITNAGIDNLRLEQFTCDDPSSPCPADLTGSGSVGVPDLLALLAAWGPCDPPAPGNCPADLTGSGSVGVPDLLALLAAWGPCPE